MKKFLKKITNKWDSISLVVLLVDVLVTIFFGYSLIKLNVLPIHYILIIIAVLVLLFTLSAVFIKKKKKKGLKIFGYVLSVLVLLITGIGSYYLNVATGFLNKAFKEGKDTYTNTFQVLVKEDANYNSIDDLKDSQIGYYNLTPNIDAAISELSKKITYNSVLYDDIINNFNDLDNGKINGVLIEANIYDSLKESLDRFKNNKYKVLYSYEMTFEQEVSKKEVSGNGFNIYIGGPDFTGTNYDFNMIATVNKDTHKILLTSTPRDYYVTVAGKGTKDILGYAGVWGINTSLATVENIYDIDINYFIKINTGSLVGLVDTIGGVEFCSNKAFTTTHALVQGTYDDSKGPKLNVVNGCKNYSGIEILTIARERKAYPDGDRQRQKNCQDIMISIFKKIASLNSLANLNKILDSVSELYSTNIPQETVTDMAKDIVSGTNWTFEQQSVTGSDSRGRVHLGTVEDYVMQPNKDSVDRATLKIKQVMSES